MVVQNVICMNAGDGETSYANNSFFQRTVILKVRSILDGTLKDMHNNSFRECFTIADLGCSSGPNTLLTVSQILDTIHDLCQQNNQKAPEFQVFLCDLPENDFNTIFKSLPAFYDKLKKDKGDRLGPCFISGVPGSFYGRIFPTRTLHLVHSSNSVHWLSQVPEKVENNKRNIYISKTSPPNVFEAYLKQFQKDFSTFLKLRSEEVIPSGRMVLTFLTRSIADPTCNDCCCIWELLAKSLLHLVAKGLVEEAKVDSFNLPLYTPYKDEVTAIIQKEGSFDIDILEVLEFDQHARVNDGNEHSVFGKGSDVGINTANVIRAATEPMLASHFGHSIIDDLFASFGKHVNDYESLEKIKFLTIAISLTKK